jgi:hypothetical protein
MDTAVDPEEHLIQVPPVAGSQTAAAQAGGVCLSELEAPFADSFVGEGDAPHGHQLLDVAIAEGEAEVQPHAVADDL